MTPPAAAALDDDRDVAREGYRPLFRRGLGGFTAFAAGFSYLSILTGVVQNFYLGYREAGPALVWTWPAVFLGQLLLALCFAELAREFPFCGGVYAWSRRSGRGGEEERRRGGEKTGVPSPLLPDSSSPPLPNSFLGWLTGWVYLGSLVVTLAAVALAWQIVLPAVWSGFQFVHPADPTDKAAVDLAAAQNAAVLGAALIAVSTVINVVGTRVFAAVMNAGVVIELVAAVLLAAFLAAHAVRGPEVFFALASGGVQPHRPDGLAVLGPFLAAAVMSAYVMYGFDTAGTLAEETVDPRRQAPRAILQALAAAAFLGLLVLAFAVTAAPDLTDARLGAADGGLPFLIKGVLGEGLGTAFILASVVAVFVCTLAVQASAARVLFAMARDRAVPGWAWLGRVDPAHQTPRAAAVLVGGVGALLLLVNMNSVEMMTALVCVSIVWANLAYLLTTGRQLARRLASGGRKPPV